MYRKREKKKKKWKRKKMLCSVLININKHELSGEKIKLKIWQYIISFEIMISKKIRKRKN